MTGKGRLGILQGRKRQEEAAYERTQYKPRGNLKDLKGSQTKRYKEKRRLHIGMPAPAVICMHSRAFMHTRLSTPLCPLALSQSEIMQNLAFEQNRFEYSEYLP